MGVRVETNAEPIPGYKLIERLGGGGFGEVWKCEAPGGLHKAIKFVFGSLELAGDSGQRAEQELKALSRVKTVRHPYILSLERYDILDGQLIIVMELADRNLWDRYKECRTQGLPGIPRDELLNYMEEAAEALDLMNNQYQLQHLDIKPQNIFLIHNHVKVADFGLVKDLEGSQASITGGITPVYAAPETFDGKVSRFSDQYSLAIVYQELLTGQRPFTGNNVRQLIMQHLSAEPNLAPLEAPDRPAIGRSLSKESDQRFPTCRDMVHALRHASRPGGGATERIAEGGEEDAAAPVTPSRRRPASPLPAEEAGPTLREGAGQRTPPPAPSDEPAGGPKQEPTPFGPSADNRQPMPGQSVTHCLRGTTAGHRPSAVGYRPEEEMPASSSDRQLTADSRQPMEEEAEGDGLLSPTLVIGLGGVGCAVLESFRTALVERFGSPEGPGNVRTLLIDTDPSVKKLSADSCQLTADSLLLTPLNRPSHYLRPQNGRTAVEDWLGLRLLYRIPREQVTTGLRALGRLAFCDNFRALHKRLQAELEACRDPDLLAAAAEQTGLGIRSHRPRVYVVAGLMGGTGSGMFVDLAYTLRALLRRLGYGRPEVIGLLLTPLISLRASRQGTRAASAGPPSPPALSASIARAASVVQNGKGNPQAQPNPVPLGNACAALAELYHFARPDTKFSARYQDKEPLLTDSEPPFSRTVLLSLPEPTQAQATAEVVGMAARFLLGDGCFALDRLTAAGRAGLPAPPPPRRGQYFETFGSYRLAFPRRRIVQRLASLSLHKIVQRWMSKDASPLVESVRSWVEEQWRGHELGAEHFIGRVQQACEKRLGKAPEEAFSAALAPLLKTVGEAGPPGSKGSGVRARSVLTPEDVAEVLARYQDLLGRPEGVEDTTLHPGEASPPAPVPQALGEAAAAIAAEWSQKLAELPVRLIEQPAFRLAGAEEAVRLVVASIEKVLAVHEPLARELADRATAAYAKLMTLLAQAPGGHSWPRRGTATPQEIINLLRDYPKCRHQALVLQQVLGVYVSLRGHLTDTLREINFCRLRLGELASGFASSSSVVRGLKSLATDHGPRTTDKDKEYATAVEGPGQYVFHAGCEDLDQAVSQGETVLGHETLLELDGRIQKVIRSRFGSLVQICLAPANVTRNVARAMSEAAEVFIEERLEKADVARLFLDLHPTRDAAADELIALYEEAVPEASRTASARTVAAQTEVTVLLAPAGASGDTVRELAESALVETSLITAASGDDLLLYREWSNLALTDLENLGPVGQEAYRQLLATDNFPPHSRLDIEFELPL